MRTQCWSWRRRGPPDHVAPKRLQAVSYLIISRPKCVFGDAIRSGMPVVPPGKQKRQRCAEVGQANGSHAELIIRHDEPSAESGEVKRPPQPRPALHSLIRPDASSYVRHQTSFTSTKRQSRLSRAPARPAALLQTRSHRASGRQSLPINIRPASEIFRPLLVQ